MKEQYFVQNVFVGIANNYDKRITSYPFGEGLLKGRPGHASFYAGFVLTPEGLKCVTDYDQKNQIYPVYEKHMYIKKDYACEVEPISFYMEPDKVPTMMTREEISNFVANVYSREKWEEQTIDKMMREGR